MRFKTFNLEKYLLVWVRNLYFVISNYAALTGICFVISRDIFHIQQYCFGLLSNITKNHKLFWKLFKTIILLAHSKAYARFQT